MQKIVSCFLMIVSSYFSFAQQNHYIYIQSDPTRVFYIKLNNKLYSSTESGYLILPQLRDGSYELQVGFPMNEFPEQKMNCKINHKDAGYLLKNFGEKGWGLFNFQTMEVVMAEPKEQKTVIQETRTDAFSGMLANVVNDPTIRQKETEQEEIVTPVAPKVVKDTPVVEKKVVVKTIDSPIVVKKVQVKITETPVEEKKAISIMSDPPVAKRSTVKRTLYNKSKEGIEMVYVDYGIDGKNDTIRVFISSEKKNVEKVEKKDVAVESKPEVKTEPTPKGKDKFIDIDMSEEKKDSLQEAKINKDKEEKKDNKKEEVKTNYEIKITPVLENQNCKSEASDDDFLKLRKKMAAGKDGDNMISVAKKAFKQKCFNTEQIKNLSVLLLKDDEKYRFFDESYRYVSNPSKFASLKSQLTDPYYISHFNSIIHP